MPPKGSKKTDPSKNSHVTSKASQQAPTVSSEPESESKDEARPGNKVTRMLEKMSSTFASRFDKIDAQFIQVLKENEVLRESLVKKDKEIANLKDTINNIDLSHRSASIRILGLPISNDTTPMEIINTAYNLLIKPILTGAMEKGEIPAVPPALAIIEFAYSMPAKNNQPCPIVLTLHSRLYRSLIFKYRREFAPTFSENNKIKTKFPFSEDLTPATFHQYRAFLEDERVQSVWTINGQIRFRLPDNDYVFKIRSLADTVDLVTNRSPSSSSKISDR